MTDIRRILIRSPNWIGDQVLAYPFFHYLRELYPDAHIAVSCVPWVESVQFRNLVNEVISIAKPSHPTWSERWQAFQENAQALRKKGPWDLGITLPNSFSSAWLMYRSKVGVRRGFGADTRNFLLNDPVPWAQGSDVHRSEAYVRLLSQPKLNKKSIREFWGAPAENELDPRIPGVCEIFPAEKAWNTATPLHPPKQSYWVLAPGAVAESRRWSVEKFAQLAKKISLEKGLTGVIVGGAAEKSLASLLIEDSSLNLLDWTGRGSVADLWRVFRNAQFTVANDSGLAHVAALCGSPVQIVWGAGQPKITEPLGPGRVRILFNPVECWPCQSNYCNQVLDKKLECLKGIHPETVWEEIQSGIRA